ncbi:hypothetical protein H0B56_12120 [Haloechinothrix sp. YIM 98757]|uniref:Uncharacterized protein n=1 Tax=Haloechinothrix aidingensis TaxID=2752311 RepID=A0A838AAP1_9PSEU|nr:hypothetical protein [Haloechinothrix aidingensis]MBA0126288.1 hypothetical protein [Haloechinothrix aidingensis]
MRQDIKNHVAIAQSIVPGSHSGGDQTGSGVDLANYDAAAMVFDVGAVTDNSWTFTVEHSDDDGATDAYAEVDADELDGTTPDAPDANTVTVVGYHGIKQWVRVVATDGGTGDAEFGVSVLRARGRAKP